MFRKLLLATLALAAFSLPIHAQDNLIGEICNKGNITLHVARVIYSVSILSGISYQVSGWTGIEPGNCEVVYNSSNDEDAYFGFTGLDSNMKVRTYTTAPRNANGGFKAMSQKICVAPSAFSYTVKTKDELSSCKLGFEPLEFTLFFKPEAANAYRTSFTMVPVEENLGNAISNNVAATARLIFGNEVSLYGTQWSYTNGGQLPATLIDSKTGLPPLLPKQQYSPAQDPVAGYYKQIKDIIAAFQPCTAKVAVYNGNVTGPYFALDDYGVVASAYRITFPATTGDPIVVDSNFGAAIANLDLDKPTINDQGSNCVSVSFICKNGLCVRHGDNADSQWVIYLNSHDQADAFIKALRSIVPYDPDGSGEIQNHPE